jgi:hypothetical protein
MNEPSTNESVPRRPPVHVLLCTGSRLLAKSEFEATAQSLLAARIQALPHGSVVVFGDCDEGPDAWAHKAVALRNTTARDTVLRWRMFSTDGWIYDEHMSRSSPWKPADEIDRMAFKGRALARNVQMARECANLKNMNFVVEAIALEAAWSSTKGTAHTAARALELGIGVVWIKFVRPQVSA